MPRDPKRVQAVFLAAMQHHDPADLPASTRAPTEGRDRRTRTSPSIRGGSGEETGLGQTAKGGGECVLPLILLLGLAAQLPIRDCFLHSPHAKGETETSMSLSSDLR